MEALTRLVSDSLARHGLDRPVDPRRLQWSRWFRCDSPHSLLVVPSKPGIFALAEEIMDLTVSKAHVGTAAPGCPTERSSVATMNNCLSGDFLTAPALQRCEPQPPKDAVLPAEGRRMLAVVQFSEDDNMAFVLDRMFTYTNPMRARLHAGNCFVRFVIVEDHHQRRSICAALNQWMRSSIEKATGIAGDFSSSLELSLENVAWPPSPACRTWGAKVDAKEGTNADAKSDADLVAAGSVTEPTEARSHPHSGAGSNLQCPQPFPSGF